MTSKTDLNRIMRYQNIPIPYWVYFFSSSFPSTKIWNARLSVLNLTKQTNRKIKPNWTSSKRECSSITNITGKAFTQSLSSSSCNTERQWSIASNYLFVSLRIVDNMPVTWCYDVEDNQKFCNPGFPIGCYVTDMGRAKDACVVNVCKTYPHYLHKSYVECSV